MTGCNKKKQKEGSLLLPIDGAKIRKIIYTCQVLQCKQLFIYDIKFGKTQQQLFFSGLFKVY